jgi:sugar/nucleoside kinase (ribokinase family)
MSQNKQQKDILVVGELNMDLILNNVASFPELGKEKIAGDMNLTLGSSSAIFAANAARLGLSVGFCGMIGNDDFGASVINDLRQYGVDTSAVVKSDQYKTGLTAIIRQGDDRAMVTYPGAMDHFSMDDIAGHAFEQARHLHISSIFLQPGVKNDLFSIIEKAKSNGMSVSVDTQWDPDENWDIDLEKLLNTIDFFLPNESEFLALTGAASVEEGLSQIQQYVNHCIVVVKRGTDGASFLEGQHTSTVPAYQNPDPVDAIGAGDSFNAGFIYRFLCGDAIERCVQFGNITGAVSTCRAGGTAAITSLEDVITIAKQNFNIADIDEFTAQIRTAGTTK